jgi:hypothetical protein
VRRRSVAEVKAERAKWETGEDANVVEYESHEVYNEDARGDDDDAVQLDDY